MLRVVRHENIFIFFLMAIKTAGSAQRVRVGCVSGNTAFFLFTPNSIVIVSVSSLLFIWIKIR